MPAPPFKRKQPPLPALIIGGILVRGVFGPLMWAMQKLGRVEKMITAMGERRRKESAEKNPFLGYQPGPQDVFVMTYAKSGTNWMMQIAYQLIHHGKGEYEHIHNVVPWPDAVLMSPMMRGYAVPLDQAAGWQTAPERKRVIKTHFEWQLIPYSEEARYIAVIRDPKDAFVSGYFFLRDTVMGAAMPPLETMYRMFLKDRAMLGGSWAENAATFWAQRHRPNVLVMSFKSMKRDLEAAVRRVAEFLDIHVSDEVIREVCRQASFEYMKSIDHKFAPGRMSLWGKPAVMVRKGQQGGSGELLTIEQQRAIDEHCMAAMKRLAPDFPYEEFCDVTLPAVSKAAGS